MPKPRKALVPPKVSGLRTLWKNCGPNSPHRGAFFSLSWGRGARVEERTCSVNMRLAMDMLNLHLRLIQSALGQKAEAKPMGFSHRERSQGRAVMRGHEVASLPGEMGPPLGQSHER